MLPNTLVPCKCTSHKCGLAQEGYTEITQPARQRHLADDLQQKFSSLTLHSSLQTELLEVQELASNDENFHANTQNVMQTKDDFREMEDPQQKSHPSLDTFGNLTAIEEQYIKRAEACDSLMKLFNINNKLQEGLGMWNEQILLQQHISWMTTTMANMKGIISHGNGRLEKYCNTLVDIFKSRMKRIREWEIHRYDMLSSLNTDATNATPGPLQSAKDLNLLIFNTGYIYVFNSNITWLMSSADCYFSNPLTSCHPVLLVAFFLAVVLSVMHGLPRRASNFY